MGSDYSNAWDYDLDMGFTSVVAAEIIEDSDEAEDQGYSEVIILVNEVNRSLEGSSDFVSFNVDRLVSIVGNNFFQIGVDSGLMNDWPYEPNTINNILRAMFSKYHVGNNVSFANDNGSSIMRKEAFWECQPNS